MLYSVLDNAALALDSRMCIHPYVQRLRLCSTSRGACQGMHTPTHPCQGLRTPTHTCQGLRTPTHTKIRDVAVNAAKIRDVAVMKIRDEAVNAAMEGIPRPSCNNDSSGITQGEGLF